MSAFRILSTPGVLYLSGEIDLAASDEVLAAGTATLASSSALTIDLGAVTFLDSSAIGAIIELRRIADDAGKRVPLANVPPRVHRLLDITGLSSVFEIRSVTGTAARTDQVGA